MARWLRVEHRGASERVRWGDPAQDNAIPLSGNKLALELAAAGTARAGGSARNAREAKTFTDFAAGVDPARRALLSDAMTSGGLLAAVPPGAAMEGVRIGALGEGDAGSILVL